MYTFTYTVQVNATPEKVFAHITDFTNHTKWYDFPWRVEKVPQGALVVGSKLQSVGDDPFGKQTPNDITVTEYQSPTRFAFNCKDPRFPDPTFHEFTLKAQDGGTFIERKFSAESPFPFNILIPYVIEPFQGRPANLRAMNRIKSLVEGK